MQAQHDRTSKQEFQINTMRNRQLQQHFVNKLSRYTVLLLAVMTFHSSWAQTDGDQQAQLDTLKKNIEQLKKELAETKSNRNDVHQALEKTETSIGELNKKAEQLKRELDQRKKKLNNLRDERSQLDKQKQQQQATVGQYINAAYRAGQQSNLRLLLNQQEPARVSRNLKYYSYFVDARQQKIASYISTIERINAIEPEIAFEATKIQQNVDKLNTQKQQLNNAQSSRRQLLAKLDKNIVSQDQRLKSLLEDRSRLERLLSQVLNNVDDVKLSGTSERFGSLKGQIPWPIKGRVLQTFGSDRIGNKLAWEGMLISSPAGTPVKAVHYGRVVFSDYLRGHGLLIIVDHGTGFMSLYAHNQTLYKTLGEWVDTGDTIASVGNSGGQKQSALYFELRHEGKPTNPQRWLKRA
ncbi:Murein hydrolase activator EnvC [Thalassocella blandensis]|nr:Murein hydrolase activator EnvC [Thalassocella blandensis]